MQMEGSAGVNNVILRSHAVSSNINGVPTHQWRHNVGLSLFKLNLERTSYSLSALTVYLYPSYATFKVLARREGTHSQDVEKWCNFSSLLGL